MARAPLSIYSTISIIKKLHHNTPKMRGVKGRSDFFRKFIQFGSAIRPLGAIHILHNTILGSQRYVSTQHKEVSQSAKIPYETHGNSAIFAIMSVLGTFYSPRSRSKVPQPAGSGVRARRGAHVTEGHLLLHGCHGLRSPTIVTGPPRTHRPPRPAPPSRVPAWSELGNTDTCAAHPARGGGGSGRQQVGTFFS